MTSIDSPHSSSLTLDASSASASPALTSSPAFHPLVSSLDDPVDLATLEETETSTPIHSHLEASSTPIHSLEAASTPLHSSLDASSTPLHTHIPSQSSTSSLDDTLMHDDASTSLFSPALTSSQPSLDDIPVIPIPSVKLKDEEDDDDDAVEDESEEESDEEESEEEASEDEDGNSRRRPRDSVGDEDDDEPLSKRPRTQSSSFLQVPSSSLVASSSPSLASSSPHHKLSIDESPSITSSQPDSSLFSTFDTSSHHDVHDNLFADADEDLIPLSPRPSQMNGNHHHIQDISLGRGMVSPSNKQSVTQYLLGVQGYTPSSRATGESSVADDPNVEIEYGTMISDVYGWKMTEHAQALGTDEPVELIRWQEHPHDPYAIRVENVMNEFCGVLGKDDASALAPLLDRHWIKLHGSTLVKDENQFRVRIHVMGLPIHCLEAEKWIRKWPSRYISKQNPNYGLPSTGTAGIEDQPTGPMDGIQLREIESDLEKLFDFAGDLNKMPMAPKPAAIVTHLYPYQRQGLHWMLEQESQRFMATDDSSFLFWEKKVDDDGTISYYNKATRATQKEPPERNRGGILADEMGLGKTLQIISLIAATSHDCLVQERKASWLNSFKIEDDDEDHDRDTTPFQLKDYVSRAREGKQAPTLIVCPLSVITNWQQQCARHTREHYLSVITYHGQHRAKIVDQLKHHDVVITTYNILASEYHGQVGEDVDEDEPVKPKPKKKKSSSDSPDFKPTKRRVHRESPLFKMRWFRVVLDEAHIIRDRNTRQSRAAVALKAERRWAVTGTPFQNRIGDAFALLAFLRVQPFTNHNIWSRLIITPLKNRDPKGLERLQMTMSAICLRRKKTEEIDGKPILTLPPKYQHVIKVELSPHEQSLYDILAMSGKAQFRAMMSDDQVLSNYAYVLEILLRMRQACDHISLIPEAYHHGFDRQHVDEMKRLLMLLDESLTDDCALCHRVVEDPVITPCAHFYCKKCFEDTVPKMVVPTCPSCAMPVVLDKVVSHDMAKKIVHADQAKLDRDATRAAEGNDSAKLKRLIIELRRQKQEDPTSKAIVFSQWTSFLNIVQAALFRKGITYVRLDGDMSSTNRAKALEAFENNPSIRVFLISLKAGGVGLNLTTANKVFLMDPWWNPATEDQAVDRVHRLGQTKPVEVIRFIAANTLEEKILELQNTKRQMISTALSRYQKSRKEQQEERLNDLAILFK